MPDQGRGLRRVAGSKTLEPIRLGCRDLDQLDGFSVVHRYLYTSSLSE
jgi:hypothetical protein